MNIDFDPDELLLFPPVVEKRMSSREYMQAIKSQRVQDDQIAIWFLGQNSWILKTPDDVLVCIDPYLSDWCASKDTGARTAKSRLLPIFIEPEDLDVDLVLITHSHADHCDPLTLRCLGRKAQMRFFAPWQCLPVLDEAGVPSENVTLIHPRQTEYYSPAGSGSRVSVTAVFALPTNETDLNHVGFVLGFLNGKTYYNSGDTAYHELVGIGGDRQPDLMSVCINGGYHNLSHWEAARLTAAIKPKIAVPAHYDMMPHNLQSPHMFRKSLWEHDKEIIYHRMEYYEPYFF